MTAERHLEQLADQTERLHRAEGGRAISSSGVYVSAGAVMVIVVGLLGIAALLAGWFMMRETSLKAEHAIALMAEAHRADMAELENIRSIAEFARSQSGVARTTAEQVAQRIAKLESRNEPER